MTATKLTNHAFERIEEGNSDSRVKIRTKMSAEEIVRIIDSDDEYLPLGIESGTNRVHKLFYSDVDDECFIVIQDKKTGEVITILPVKWHNRWKISDHALVLAKYIRGFGPKPFNPKTSEKVVKAIKKEESNKENIVKLRFGCLFQAVDQDGFPLNTCRSVILLKLDMTEKKASHHEKDNFSELINNSELLEELRSLFRSSIRDSEILSAFYIRKSRRKGTRFLINPNILLE